MDDFNRILIETWRQTRMERDKAFLFLSAGGIGILVTILCAFGITYWWEIILYALSFTFFILSLATILEIFKENAIYIENLYHRKNQESNKLKKLDCRLIWFFWIAVIVSIINGFSAAIRKFFEEVL